MLTTGQNLLLNNRRWHIRAVRPLAGRAFELEAIGTSDAAQGMTRTMTAYLYGEDLLIEQPQPRFGAVAGVPSTTLRTGPTEPHRARSETGPSPKVFEKIRQPRLWHAHLERDWRDDLYGPALQAKPATWLDLLAAHTRQSALGPLKNEFSWSFSRAKRYRHCPRAYYYHSYAAWEGWLDESPAPVKQVYLLKNLTDLPRWIGSLVHETIKFGLARLKAGQPMAATALRQHMHRRAQTDFADSQSGRYQQQPNQLTGFQEHYYQTGLTQADWSAAWQQAEQHLTTFLNSALYADFQQQPPATFLDVETLQSFSFGGEKVWLQMDLARREADSLWIYDWKTGSVEDEASLRYQLGIYGLYFRQVHPDWVADRALRGLVYGLAEDRLLELELDEALLAETSTQVVASQAHLKARLTDPEANLADITAFPMIDDLAVCRFCQFRELCGRA